MNFKTLTVAAAIVFMTGLGAVAPASAQNAAPAAPAASAPAPDASAAPAAAPAPDATAPAPAGDKPSAAAAAPDQSTPYGLGHIWATGSIVSRGILIVLAVMSLGTWYIFFTKWIDQQRILGQVKTVEKKFWTSATLNDGIAEAGVNASTGGTSLVGMNDWIGMSLTRQLEDANGKLQGGVTFLASVGSVSPFVGLFGTVMGILNALIGIGVAGQASIDKVAGPVGEALIMTALGLAVAVPAVLLYNYLVRRNKVITEKLRAFAGDLQAYLITKSK